MLLKEKGKKILRGEILEAGADSCVSKPVDPDEFKAQLNAGERIVRLEKELKEAFHNIKSKNEVLEKTLHELQTTQAQMLQSEKMSSIGQLAAGIAHEINNPTGFVSSNLKTLGDYLNDISELIKEYRLLVSVLVDVEKGEKIPDSVPTQLRKISAREEEIDLEFLIDDIKDIIEDCKEGTDRIKKIVVNLKEFAHPGEDELQRKDINQGIESTLSVVWNELKYKADVIKDLGELPSVKCYPQQLNQVFMNLLINGSQAIEGRGEIRIKTRAAEKYIEVEISDTGSGIPKENLGKIFDPFFTTKGVGKGTGLGLNVSYNIIKKHHGTLEVESEVGKGSLFRIRIPVE
jgi:signal transduction histidine kinase